MRNVFANAIDAARGDTPMNTSHATAEKLLSSACMNYTPRHVAHGAVTGTSSITSTGQREVTITAADGWTGPEWDRVAADMDAHNGYLHHDYRLLEDGREQWSLIYGDTA